MHISSCFTDCFMPTFADFLALTFVLIIVFAFFYIVWRS